MRTNQEHAPGQGVTDLRMLWYPYVGSSGITPDAIDEAMRRGRRERAEIAVRLLRGTGRLLARLGRAVLRSNAAVQQRRAAAILARYGIHPPLAQLHPPRQRCQVAQLLTSPEPAQTAAKRRRLAA